MVDVLKNPAEHLEGRQIGDWKVVERIINEDGHTGGNFSVGYIVRNKFGDEAFLKAMNYIKAIGKPNQADELYRLTQAFRFERDLLIACANGHMKYVVTAFSEAVEGFNPNMKDKELRHELQMLVREMCNPDIDKRGDSKERGIAKFSLYRYITRLDILASRYEYSLKKGIYS